MERLGIREQVFGEAGIEVFYLDTDVQGDGEWRSLMLDAARPEHQQLHVRMPAHALQETAA